MFKDVLLVTASYPEPTPEASIVKAVDFAAMLDSTISAIALEVSIPSSVGFLAEGIVDVAGMIKAARNRSAAAAQDLLAVFEHAAIGKDVFGDCVFEQCTTAEAPALLVAQAHVRDLTVVPIGEVDGVEQWYAETIIFGAGRPVLVLPHTSAAPVLNSVLLAWDASRAAARALADAMPILTRAKRVTIVTIINEKPIQSGAMKSELARHLAKHGVDPDFREVDSQGRPIGDVLRATIAQQQCDLVVMGAFGHSRIRDFILGGATKSLLADAPVPLFVSH
jgi:nucleotide-binding universal stress UspA family protein